MISEDDEETIPCFFECYERKSLIVWNFAGRLISITIHAVKEEFLGARYEQQKVEVLSCIPVRTEYEARQKMAG